MDRNEICGIIEEKIGKVTRGRTDGKPGEGHRGEFLTGPYWNLSAVDMVYLYYEVCSHFRIRIGAGELEGYRFATIDGIADIVSGGMAGGCR